MQTWTARRAEMVDRDIAARGVRDERVLQAMRAVPRERFVPEHRQDEACADHPLPIGGGQTISQPYIVALMSEALQLSGGERVLEIGTGSGYAAAVLSRLAREVHTVERIASLAEAAMRTLAELRAFNVQVHIGDGSLGWPDAAPYDAIAVTAAGPRIPAALRAQLAPGGRLVMPVGRSHGAQELLRLTRAKGDDEEDRSESLCGVAFVPLLGAQGWNGG
jgi:protein-L-isoaspartate(D-aspartate) O-methyltransferase